MRTWSLKQIRDAFTEKCQKIRSLGFAAGAGKRRRRAGESGPRLLGRPNAAGPRVSAPPARSSPSGSELRARRRVSGEGLRTVGRTQAAEDGPGRPGPAARRWVPSRPLRRAARTSRVRVPPSRLMGGVRHAAAMGSTRRPRMHAAGGPPADPRLSHLYGCTERLAATAIVGLEQPARLPPPLRPIARHLCRRRVGRVCGSRFVGGSAMPIDDGLMPLVQTVCPGLARAGRATHKDTVCGVHGEVHRTQARRAWRTLTI